MSRSQERMGWYLGECDQMPSPHWALWFPEVRKRGQRDQLGWWRLEEWIRWLMVIGKVPSKLLTWSVMNSGLLREECAHLLQVCGP